MKTLIATLAAVSTMATAANAFGHETLSNCMNVAAIKAVSVDYNLTVEMLNAHMRNPKYAEDATAVYDMTHKIVMNTIKAKANNMSMYEVVNIIDEGSDVFVDLATVCIGNYYISYQN